jgi:hypothetical protein
MKYFPVPESNFAVGLFGLLSLMVTFLLLYLVPQVIAFYPVVTSQCDIEPCVQPTTIDQNLKLK